MTDSAIPRPATYPWLSEYLDEAIARNLCVRVGCTTCGATEFRHGLYAHAAAAVGITPRLCVPGHNRAVFDHLRQARNDESIRAELAKQLSLLDPNPASRRKWFDAVRLIFCELWWTVGAAIAERDYQPTVEGTWAGSILRAMQAHFRRRNEEREQYELFNSPEAVQARREGKRRLKQQAHAERLKRKRERDRLWFEQHPITRPQVSDSTDGKEK